MRRAGLFGLTFATLVSSASATSHEAHPFSECRDDAILVFDASGSMASTDTSGNISRIHRVREAVEAVVPNVARYRDLGLIVYGAGTANACAAIEMKVAPAPNNAVPIILALKGVLPNGRTPLSDSVALAAEALDFRAEPATVVLLTDGEENCGGDPCALGRKLEAEGANIRVHVIDYKLRLSSEWQGTMHSRCLAETTDGKYIAVNTTEELVDALRETLDCPQVSLDRRH
jgi:Ca-activated chloride channel family protein